MGAGVSAHWCLQLPITSTPTSAGHFLSRLGPWRLLGTEPGAGILGPFLKACPPGRAGQKAFKPFCLPAVHRQSHSGTTGQVTGETEGASNSR